MVATKKLILTKDKKEPELVSLEESYIKFERFLCKLILPWEGTFEKEDLLSIAIVGLSKAYNSYNLEKNILFMSYLGTIVNNELKMFYRKEKRHLNIDSLDRKILNQKDRENITLGELIPSKINCEEKIISNITCMELIKIINSLEDRDRLIAHEFYLKNKPQIYIAENLGISQSSISKIIKKIQRNIKTKYKKGMAYK